jgi:osmotically-inducible protein OsmY
MIRTDQTAVQGERLCANQGVAFVAPTPGITRHSIVNDKLLQQSVIDELSWDPSFSSEHIGVTAKDGVITLSGHVPSYWEKRSALAAAIRVKGVKAVAEEVKVKLFDGNQREDEKIAEHALQSLLSDASVPNDSIKLTVERGLVTLTGEVEWNYQKMAAEYAVQRLTGVLCVLNDIKIMPPVQAYQVREKIEKALTRVAAFEAQQLSINIDGSKVTLCGKLENSHERDLAERAAWSVPGVTQVQDKIALKW